MGPQGNSVEDLLQLAREDLARNSLSSAEKTLEQAILLNNQAPEAFHLLGNVYSKRGKFKKAIMAFERTLALDPFHTEAAIALSSLYNDMGKYQEGAKVYFKTKRRLARTLPGHDPLINQSLSRRHEEMAFLYMRYERFQEAHDEFMKALRLVPENISYSVQIAKCLSRVGNREGAVNFLRKTLEKHPKNVEARVQLGVLYHALQKLGDAYREWQEAIALDPENKSAQMYLSMLEYEPAISEIQ